MAAAKASSSVSVCGASSRLGEQPSTAELAEPGLDAGGSDVGGGGAFVFCLVSVSVSVRASTITPPAIVSVPVPACAGVSVPTLSLSRPQCPALSCDDRLLPDSVLPCACVCARMLTCDCDIDDSDRPVSLCDLSMSGGADAGDAAQEIPANPPPPLPTDSGDAVRGMAAISSWRRAVRSSGMMFFTGRVPALPGLRGPMGLRPCVAGGERARIMSMAAGGCGRRRSGA